MRLSRSRKSASSLTNGLSADEWLMKIDTMPKELSGTHHSQPIGADAPSRAFQARALSQSREGGNVSRAALASSTGMATSLRLYGGLR